MLLLAQPPSLDAGEITDKGYLNQRRTLQCRAADVLRLYADPPDPGVITYFRLAPEPSRDSSLKPGARSISSMRRLVAAFRRAPRSRAAAPRRQARDGTARRWETGSPPARRRLPAAHRACRSRARYRRNSRSRPAGSPAPPRTRCGGSRRTPASSRSIQRRSVRSPARSVTIAPMAASTPSGASRGERARHVSRAAGPS